MKGKKIKAISIFIIIAIVEMLAVAGFIGFKVFTLSKGIRALNSLNATLRQKIDSANTVSSLQSDLTSANKDLSATEELFFDDKSLLAFLKDLSNTAAKYGITVNSITFGNVAPALDTTPPLKTLPVTIEVSASYDNLVGFLRYLETFSRYIVENSVSLSYGAKANTSVNITFYVITQSSGRWVYKGDIP